MLAQDLPHRWVIIVDDDHRIVVRNATPTLHPDGTRLLQPHHDSLAFEPFQIGENRVQFEEIRRQEDLGMAAEARQECSKRSYLVLAGYRLTNHGFVSDVGHSIFDILFDPHIRIVTPPFLSDHLALVAVATLARNDRFFILVAMGFATDLEGK